MSQEDLQRVKDRITKLLAKAGNNSNDHEAALAAARARKLMDQYQLDEFDISVAADENLFAEELADEAYQYTPKWREWIATRVAQYNDCQARMFTPPQRTQYGRAPKSVIMWRGFKDDVALAKQMYYYLVAQIDAATSANQKDLGYTRYNARLGTIFKEAMAARICERLIAMTQGRKEQQEMEATTSTSLAVYKEHQVTAHYGEATYKQSKDRGWDEATAEEMDAFFAGADAGKVAHINTGVEEK